MLGMLWVVIAAAKGRLRPVREQDLGVVAINIAIGIAGTLHGWIAFDIDIAIHLSKATVRCCGFSEG